MNLDMLSQNPGVVAVASGTADTPYPAMTHVGPEAWQPLMQQAMLLMQHTTEPSLRMVVGGHTVIVQREGKLLFAVCLPTGHAFGKSVRRAIRRAAKAAART
jgi:hypothetical protein